MKKARRVMLAILTVLMLAFPVAANAAEECTCKEDCAAQSHNEECLALLIRQLPDVSGQLDTKYYYYDQLSDVEKVMYWKFSEVTEQVPYVTVCGLRDEMEYDPYHPFCVNRKNSYNDSALGCLVYNTAVCAGFSDTVKILCDTLEIPCIVVGNGGHAWNFVRLDDGL